MTLRLGICGLALAALAACVPSLEEASGSGATSAAPAGSPTTLSYSTSGKVDTPTFGDVQVVCDLDTSALGRRVDRRPERGRAQYTLYDTAPGSAAPRAFHLTGFDDGCARRFAAALAMFGSVEMYELMYHTGLVKRENASTDRAYAALRAGSCAASGPCTGPGLTRLSRKTAFLNAYARGGASPRLELLMHDGVLTAMAEK